MSETSRDPAGAAPPVPRNSPLDPPARRRLDPAAIMIGIGGAVLLVALWWLLNTPRSTQEGAIDPARLAQIEQQLGTISGRLGTLAAVEGRVQAVEARPAPVLPDLRPLEQQITALAERSATNERRVSTLEGRPVLDLAAVAPRNSIDTLGARLEQAMTRLQGLEAELDRRLQEAQRADEQRERTAQQALAQRLAEAQRADEQRDQGIAQRLQEAQRAEEQRDQALAQRLQEAQRADEQRDQAITQRIQDLQRADEQRDQGIQQRLQEAQRADEQRDQAAQQRVQALESQLGQRLQALEQAQAALRQQLERSVRMASLDRVRAALVAGQPLGEGLSGLGTPPQPLVRFAQSAPPTEAKLRQSFEEAARAARNAMAQGAAQESGRPPAVEGVLSRIEGLVTVRRGDQVLVGDTIDADLERARRAIEAGDLEMSLQQIGTLPQPAQAAMQSWVEQARALLAARAALRQLAAG